MVLYGQQCLRRLLSNSCDQCLGTRIHRKTALTSLSAEAVVFLCFYTEREIIFNRPAYLPALQEDMKPEPRVSCDYIGVSLRAAAITESPPYRNIRRRTAL